MSKQSIGPAPSPATSDNRPSYSLPILLTWIVAAVVAIDCVWDVLHRFDIDLVSFSRIAFVSLSFVAAGLFYARIRHSPHLAAMLWGAAFLIGFSAAMSILNYFLLTVAGPRIDIGLARIDAALGIDWPAMVTAMTAYPVANYALLVAYASSLPQMLLLVGWLGWKERSADIYEFCLALAISAVITVAFWTLFPSFGAFSVYELPVEISRQLKLALDSHYAHELVGLLAHGPGRISPHDIKGLIGFPSFHATLAVLPVWYVRSFRRLFVALFVWNAAVLVSIPIQGGHHVIDIPAGLAVAAVAICLATIIRARLERRPVRIAFTEPSTNRLLRTCPAVCEQRGNV